MTDKIEVLKQTRDLFLPRLISGELDVSDLDIKTGERLLDPRRAERLPWCYPTLINAQDNLVKVWDYKEVNGRIRTYVWLQAWDYVVILEKRKHRIGKIAFLIIVLK